MRMGRFNKALSGCCSACPAAAISSLPVPDSPVMSTRARPLPGDALEGQLPERFFQAQESLRGEAKRLVAAAAGGQSSDALAMELGKLAQTCIACHDAYLHDPPANAPRAGDATPVQ